MFVDDISPCMPFGSRYLVHKYMLSCSVLDTIDLILTSDESKSP
jgi:hypothetical protein